MSTSIATTRVAGPASSTAAAATNRKWITIISLVVLAVQNTSLVLIMRYSRTVKGPMYIASTAVFVTELVKVLTCIVFLVVQNQSISKTLTQLHNEIIGNPKSTLKMLVPSGLYAIQNNLLYVALSNLDAATFQVTYQLKILTTALFSVIMLGKKLRPLKWGALVLLMLGVGLVQIPSGGKTDAPMTGNPIIGLFAVLLACMSSGFAGVYFEKLLKDTNSNLWVRNVQLGVFGGAIAAVGMYINDGAAIREGGIFQGYNFVVGLVILNQAFGGLIVAVVVKYADNILKGFATSIAIVLSGLASIYLFNFVPSALFVFGTSLVLAAVMLYSRPDPPTLPTIVSVRPEEGK